MSSYKYCIVPMCRSTSIKNPEKLFIGMPRHEKIRKMWCRAMKRDCKKNKPLSNKSSRHVCEDHFELEKDTENFMRHKLQGCKIRMKKDVLPHIFHCQRPAAPVRLTAEKRRHVELVTAAICGQPSTSLDVEESPEHAEDPSVEITSNNKCIQVNIKPVKAKFRSKATNTVPQNDGSCSLIKTASDTCEALVPQPSTSALDYDSLGNTVDAESEENCASEQSDFICSNDNGDDTDYVMEFDMKMRELTVQAIELEPRLNLGIVEESYCIVSLLSERIPCPEVNVLITLKKLRLNDPFAILAQQFGMSVSNVSRIFNDTIRYMAIALQDFIFWPDSKQVQLQLPIAFRARYSKVVSIVDCFEVEIEKPSIPKHQSLTWSDYYKCNTLKYMISCTPDGLVNFISTGYGGRASDVTIVEYSGFLNKLVPGVQVMADRGFKNVSHLLVQKGCELVRPPTVKAATKSTPQEVRASRSIAALRIHVERVIGRVRDFSMLLPHACVDNHHIHIMDKVAIVVCALINMQPDLIRF